MAKSKIIVNIRRFLRSKSCVWGNGSTVQAYLEVSKTKAGGVNKHTGRPQKARGSIDCYLTLRDCNDSISLDLSSSNQQRHMIAQLSVLSRLIRDLEEIEGAYNNAIVELRDEGYIT